MPAMQPGAQVLWYLRIMENPEGGWIERDEQGNPTGKLDEMAWFQLVGEKMPPPTDPVKIQSLIKKGSESI